MYYIPSKIDRTNPEHIELCITILCRAILRFLATYSDPLKHKNYTKEEFFQCVRRESNTNITDIIRFEILGNNSGRLSVDISYKDPKVVKTTIYFNPKYFHLNKNIWDTLRIKIQQYFYGALYLLPDLHHITIIIPAPNKNISYTKILNECSQLIHPIMLEKKLESRVNLGTYWNRAYWVDKELQDKITQIFSTNFNFLKTKP